jgi:hypothetical protein
MGLAIADAEARDAAPTQGIRHKPSRADRFISGVGGARVSAEALGLREGKLGRYSMSDHKCSCGAPSKLVTYVFDEGDEEECVPLCWRCTELLMMEAELRGDYYGPEGRFTERGKSRFIELMIRPGALRDPMPEPVPFHEK